MDGSWKPKLLKQEASRRMSTNTNDISNPSDATVMTVSYSKVHLHALLSPPERFLSPFLSSPSLHSFTSVTPHRLALLRPPGLARLSWVIRRTLTPAVCVIVHIPGRLRLSQASTIAFLQCLLPAIQACDRKVAVGFGVRIARRKAHDVVVDLRSGTARVEITGLETVVVVVVIVGEGGAGSESEGEKKEGRDCWELHDWW